jgi:hypothetical protein
MTKRSKTVRRGRGRGRGRTQRRTYRQRRGGAVNEARKYFQSVVIGQTPAVKHYNELKMTGTSEEEAFNKTMSMIQKAMPSPQAYYNFIMSRNAGDKTPVNLNAAETDSNSYQPSAYENTSTSTSTSTQPWSSSDEMRQNNYEQTLTTSYTRHDNRQPVKKMSSDELRQNNYNM